MITAVVFLLFVASVPLLGGSLAKMGTVRLHAWWTIVASLIIQIFLIEILAGSLDGTISAAFHLGSYGLAIMFVWYNRHVIGMPLMVFGGMLNLAAIAANGGVMPARLSALQAAGIVTDSPEFENSAPITDAKLAILGDIFAIPAGIPFANVFSIGDIILVIGGGITVHTVGESRLWQWVQNARQANAETSELSQEMLALTDSLSASENKVQMDQSSIATVVAPSADEVGTGCSPGDAEVPTAMTTRPDDVPPAVAEGQKRKDMFDTDAERAADPRTSTEPTDLPATLDEALALVPLETTEDGPLLFRPRTPEERARSRGHDEPSELVAAAPAPPADSMLANATVPAPAPAAPAMPDAAPAAPQQPGLAGLAVDRRPSFGL